MDANVYFVVQTVVILAVVCGRGLRDPRIDGGAESTEDVRKVLARKLVILVGGKLKTYNPGKNQIAISLGLFRLSPRKVRARYKLRQVYRCIELPLTESTAPRRQAAQLCLYMSVT